MQPEMQASLIVGLSNVFVALMLIGVSIPLLRDWIPRNSLYGVRVPKAFKSESNWYSINRYGGRQLIYWSVALAVFGGVSCLVPVRPDHWFFWVSVLAPIWFLTVPIIQILRFARRLP